MTSGKLKGQGANARLVPGQGIVLAARNLAQAMGSLRDLVDRLQAWQQQRRVRRWIDGLDERALKDIGLTPADVWKEPHGDWYRM
jgi:uncharacterized protein YjiS (DUF1127 family)